MCRWTHKKTDKLPVFFLSRKHLFVTAARDVGTHLGTRENVNFLKLPVYLSRSIFYICAPFSQKSTKFNVSHKVFLICFHSNFVTYLTDWLHLDIANLRARHKGRTLKKLRIVDTIIRRKNVNIHDLWALKSIWIMNQWKKMTYSISLCVHNAVSTTAGLIRVRSIFEMKIRLRHLHGFFWDYCLEFRQQQTNCIGSIEMVNS